MPDSNPKSGIATTWQLSDRLPNEDGWFEDAPGYFSKSDANPVVLETKPDEHSVAQAMIAATHINRGRSDLALIVSNMPAAVFAPMDEVIRAAFVAGAAAALDAQDT